jgi:hypothetical protein
VPVDVFVVATVDTGVDFVVEVVDVDLVVDDDVDVDVDDVAVVDLVVVDVVDDVALDVVVDDVVFSPQPVKTITRANKIIRTTYDNSNNLFIFCIHPPIEFFTRELVYI